MKGPCIKVEAVIAALLLAACVDNRNDFAGASATSNEPTTNSLPAPENLSATTSDNEVSLSWDTVDGATAYNVYIYSESGYIQANHSSANLGAANTDDSTRVSINSHFLSSLQYEVDYYFNVTALDDVLESDQSNEVGVRPLQDLINSTPSVQLADTVVNAAEVVTLSAEVSDPDGNEVSYLWQQISGENVDIENSDQPEAYFTAPIVGAPTDLGFVVTVSDGYSASNSNVATITISDNLVPEVDAGADQSVSSGTTVELLGRVSDSDGSVVDITWQQESGSIVSLSSTSTLDTSFVAPSSSSELTLVFQLSVTDDRGASATDTVTVVVAADQGSAIVYRVDVAENSNGTIHVATSIDSEQESLTYSLSGTDADDFSIDSSSGAISFVSTPDYENPTDANQDNVYELTFEVSDGTTTTVQELIITVIDINEAPTFTSVDATVDVPENTSGTIFTLEASDVDSDDTDETLTYSIADGADRLSFSLDGAELSFIDPPNHEVPQAAGDDANIYTVELAVSDDEGKAAAANLILSFQVTDANEAPSFTSSTSVSTAENNSSFVYTATAIDVDAGDSFTYSLVGGEDQSLFDLAGAELSFKDDPDYESLPASGDNTYEVELRVTDADGLFTDLSLSIDVTDTNEAPSFTSPASVSTAENNSSFVYTATAIDVDAGDSFSYSLVGGEDQSLFDLAGAELSFKDDPDYESLPASGDNTYEVELRVTDADGLFTDLSLSINVTDTNEAPSFTSPASVSTAENNSSFVYTATAIDVDAGDSFTYSLVGGEDQSLFDLAGAELSFKDDPDYESLPASGDNTYEVELRVTDADGLFTDLSLSIDVTDTNEAPSFTSPASVSTAENNSSFVYTATAIDVDAGDSFSYSLVGGEDQSLFDLAGAELSFKDDPDYESLPASGDNTYEVELRVTDADGLFTDLSLSIDVTDTNEAPSFTSPASVSTAENNSSFVYTATAIDVDAGDSFSYSLVGGEDQSLFDLAGAELSFKDDPDYESLPASGDNTYEVELRVTDADGLFTDLSLSIDVTDTNEAPSFTSPASVSTAENNSSFVYTATAIDVDAGDSFSYSLVGGEDQSLFDLAGAELSFKDDPDYESLPASGDNTYEVELRVTDADGLFTDLSLSIDVTDTNEAPSFTSPASVSTAENNSSFVYTATAIDVDAGDSFSYSLVGGEDQSLFDLAGAELSFKDDPDYESLPASGDNTYEVELRVTDADGLFTDLSLSIDVTDTNEAPSFTSPASVSTAENNSSFVYTATAIDVDAGDSFSYSLVGGEDQSLFDLAGAELSFKDDPDYESLPASGDNTYEVELRVTDADGLFTDLSLSIDVTDTNEAPSFTSPASVSTAENNSSFVYTATAIDVDAGDSFSYSLVGGEDQSLFDLAGAELSFKDDPDYESLPASGDNTYEVELRVTDADGLFTDLSLSIDVTDTNEAPSFTSPASVSTAENNSSFVYTATAIDVDAGDSFSYSLVGGEDQSLFDLAGAELSFKDDPDYESLPASGDNTYEVELRVTDADGLFTDLSLSINVTDTNEAPSFTSPASVSTAENNSSFVYTATAIDVDAGDSFTYSLVGGEDQSLFDLAGAELSFKDDPDYESLPASGDNTYEVELRVTDADGLFTDLSLSIDVTDTNEAPSFTSPASVSTAENNSSFVYTATAIDVDAGDSFSYSLVGGEDQSLFDLAGAELSFKDDPDYESLPASGDNTYEVELRVTDADGLFTDLSLSINVTDTNEAPVFSTNPDSASAPENSTDVFYTASASDEDADASVTYSLASGGTDNDLFDLNTTSGELQFKAAPDYETFLDSDSDGVYQVIISASDGSLSANTDLVLTVTITDVSEHDAAPSAAYLGLPDNYINITFTPESGVSYQLHRSFVEGCTSSSCDAEGYKLFASPNSSGTADTMTFSQTHYYSLVGDNSTTFTTSINDSDGAKLAALVTAQSLSTEYDLANDWVNISATDSNNVTYTLYMAGEPFAAGGCEDSELDNIGSLCADGSSLSDGNMHSATEVINWSARRYYRLDISDGYQVVHSLESNASVIDPVVLSASNASLTIDITWSALNSTRLAEYTVYLSDDSAATTASAATWSSLSNSRIISGNSSELYSLIPILSQYYVAITATNTENETTPLSKVYLVNDIVTGDPAPSTWHEIIADTDDSPAHWEGRSTHGSLVFQDKMWLIGGRTASESHIAEVWSSTDGYNWTEVTPSAAFGARKEFVSMVHDGKMWVLGGEIEGNLLANDVWYSSDGATWHEATPAASWHVRDYFGGVAFASGATGSDEMWVLGHYTGDARGIPGVEDHHYSTDGSTWSSVSVSGLPPSSFFPAITFNNVILIVGGYFYTNSAWSESNTIYSSTDGVNWAELSVSGSIWDARRLHTTLVYDDKLWILAGYSGYNRDDYWYSPDGTQWHEVMASGSKWEARQVHTSVNYAGRMWMLGGYGSTGDKQLNDVWASGLEITSFSFQEVLSNSL